MSNNNLPLKVTAVRVNNYCGMRISFCDGQSAQTLFRPSASQKYIPAPYYGASVNYPERKKASTGFYQKSEFFTDWGVETTISDFVNNPPCFTYVDIKPSKPLTPNFKSDYATIVYLLKELKLTGIEIKEGAAIFTHTKGSFSFGVRESSNEGFLTLAEVTEIEMLYL